jgi:hypothetical protein
MNFSRWSLVAVIAVASLSFSGCRTNDSPKSTVMLAGKALKEKKLKAFQKLLTSEGREEFGTPDAFQFIRERLSTYEKLTISDVELLGSSKDEEGKDSSRVYRVNVEGKKSGETSIRNAVTVLVTCQIQYSWNPGHPKATNGGNWVEWPSCGIDSIE